MVSQRRFSRGRSPYSYVMRFDIMEFNLSMSNQKIEARDYDAVIIGSGAPGMSAAVYTARYGLKVVILGQSVAGGLTAEAPLVENYLGYKAIKGTDLASNFAKHAQEYSQIIDNTLRNIFHCG
ncbi:hypothetical protein [Thermoplasma volcanium GSS1]|uniref:FAD/NAD(P)-binding domain-containing protein n=1 Tax=Thermoplasma volcanium (strain ATCC 51530 / DSM 4299 / JCM 9571 / NBRC 15438 / GSS1) TaxID=273116 RepID=Q97BI7_THEVO|nr:FAD-dependent oxidoreductase [Thermoplasma volcanium]BAB59610.1 hypothetical protein [Thermoplasma volcanium GSS1]